MDELLLYRHAERERDALPEQDYTTELLRRAALEGTIPEERLTAVRDAIHAAVRERALAYTKGRSGTVTQKQAEAFYRALLYQLDLALLALNSDRLAEECLRTQPVDKLLEAGQLRIMQLYEEAKTSFRRAYQLMQPFQTMFYRELLTGFMEFSTHYDARFRGADIDVEFTYPLLGDRQIEPYGLLGVYRYYSALLHEAEFLHYFPAEEITTLMAQYAKRYLTAQDMIAESIADLVFRHWITAALLGETACTVLLPADTPSRLQTELGAVSEDMLRSEMRQLLSLSPFAGNAPLLRALSEALPVFAGTLHTRIAEGNVDGWLVFCG